MPTLHLAVKLKTLIYRGYLPFLGEYHKYISSSLKNQLLFFHKKISIFHKRVERVIMLIFSHHEMKYIEDIYFFGVNTKYISSSAVKKSVFFKSAQH